MRPINWAFLAALGSAALLLGALFFQYVLGMAPCALCYWQRWPHLAAVGLGAVLLVVPSPVLAVLGAGAAATSGGIGIYHTGVERGWFDGPSACSGNIDFSNLTAGELLDRVMAAPVVRCDEVPWEMLGLSMASWNAVLSFVLAGMWLMALRQRG
ncbi:MAG: disulfide bond formation protein B [Pararhodobacter sp.]|nr:disulfide bond formation protein B [Pararhodobacter sp.]